METKEVLEERGARYGSFNDNASVAQELKNVIRLRTGGTLHPDMQEALDMICSKISRIVTGDPNYPDNWKDIEGYSRLVHDRIVQAKKITKVLETTIFPQDTDGVYYED